MRLDVLHMAVMMLGALYDNNHQDTDIGVKAMVKFYLFQPVALHMAMLSKRFYTGSRLQCMVTYLFWCFPRIIVSTHIRYSRPL